MTYNIKDTVWIHIGERKLVEGRIVEIIDLAHLDEGHDPQRDLYIIEIKTGIDDIYEVRDYEQISPDAKGPINLFRKNKNESVLAKRFLKKVGIQLPAGTELLELESETTPSKPTEKKRYYAKRKAKNSKSNEV